MKYKSFLIITLLLCVFGLFGLFSVLSADEGNIDFEGDKCPDDVITDELARYDCRINETTKAFNAYITEAQKYNFDLAMVNTSLWRFYINNFDALNQMNTKRLAPAGYGNEGRRCSINDVICPEEWGSCEESGSQLAGRQTRICHYKSNVTCYEADAGAPNNYYYPLPGSEVLQTQPCVPSCAWLCNDWSACTNNGTQTRNCTSYTSGCGQNGQTLPSTPLASKLCCKTNYAYGVCSGGKRQVTVTGDAPACQPAVPTYTEDCVCTWRCSEWTGCGRGGAQTRVCTPSTFACDPAEKPAESQACTYVPVWECSDWSACSNGSQTRTCGESGTGHGIVTKVSIKGGEKPAETQLCDCNWQCTDKTRCINGKKQVACISANTYCGTKNNTGTYSQRKEETQTCGSPPAVPDSTWCYTFRYQLSRSSAGPSAEIRALQIALVKEGLFMGQINGVFDDYLTAGVNNFQRKYKNEILTSVGLTFATGIVGPSTRGKLNQLYGCKSVCTPIWQTTPWSVCANGRQTRTVTDSNNCGVTTNKPSEIQGCTWSCSPIWQTGAWLPCVNGTQTRTVTDSNNCGLIIGKPAISQSCTSPTVCNPSWQPGAWSACVAGTQTRPVTDANNCGTISGRPATSQACTLQTDTVTVDDVASLVKNVCEIKPEKFGQNAVCVKATATGYNNPAANNCENYCKGQGKLLDKETIIIDRQDMYPNIAPYHTVVYDPANQTSKDTIISIDPSCGRINYQDRCCTCKDASTCALADETCIQLTNNNKTESCKTYCNSSGKLPLYSQNSCLKNGASGVCCMCQDLMKCNNNWPLSECVKNDDSGKSAQTLCHDYCAATYNTTEVSYNVTTTKCAVGNATAPDVCCNCNRPASNAKNCIGKGEAQNSGNISLPCCPGLAMVNNPAMGTSSCENGVDSSESCKQEGEETFWAKPDCCEGLFATKKLPQSTSSYMPIATCQKPSMLNCARNGSAGVLPYYNYLDSGKMPCCPGTILVPRLPGENQGTCKSLSGTSGCLGDGKQGAMGSCCPGLVYVDAGQGSNTGIGTCLTPRCAAGSGSTCTGVLSSTSFFGELQNQLASILTALSDLLKK